MKDDPANDQDYVQSAVRRKVGQAVLHRLRLMADSELARRRADHALAGRILRIGALLLVAVLLGLALRALLSGG